MLKTTPIQEMIANDPQIRMMGPNLLSVVVFMISLCQSACTGSFCEVAVNVTHSQYGQNVTFYWSSTETPQASRWKKNDVGMMGRVGNDSVEYENGFTSDKVWPIDDTAFTLARTTTADSGLYTCDHLPVNANQFVLVAQSQLQVHAVSVDDMLPNLLLNATELDSEVSVDSRNEQTLSSSAPVNDPACVKVLINVVDLNHTECSHLSSVNCSLVLYRGSMLHRDPVIVSVNLFHPLVGTRELARMLHTHATPRVTIDLPAAFNVSTEGNLDISCSFSARPAALVVWRYTNGSALPGDTYRITESVSGDALKTTTSRLQWKPTADRAARIGQGGLIRCTSENDHGNVASGTMDLNVQYGPLDIGINSTDNKFSFIEGDVFTSLACIANCNPACTYSWHWANDTVVAMGNTLTFEPFNRMYHGIFHCRATNEINSDGITFNVTIDVFYGPSIHSFVVRSPSDTISQHDNVTLTCHTDSRPMPVIKMIRSSGDTLVSSSTSNTLEHTLIHIDCLDSGSYRCVANNSHTGNTSCMTKTVVVHCPPRVHTSSPTDVSASEGDTVNLTLTAIGFPKPEFTWYFNDTVFPGPSPSVTPRLTSEPDVYSSSSLILHNVTQQDFGNYSVDADNDEGSFNVNFMLTSVGAPRHPTQLKANYTNAVSITMQWTSGWDRGGEQVFTLTYRRSDSDNSYSNTTSISDPGQEKEVMKKVTGLSANISYDFIVLTTNEYGTSNTPVTTASTADKPDFGSNSDDSFSILITGVMATITWSLHTYRGPITHVNVTSCVRDSSICITTTVPPTTSKVEVAVPEGGSSYTFEFLVYDGKDLLLEVKRSATVNGGSPVGIIVGGVLVGVLVLVAAAVVGFILWRRKTHAGIRKDKNPASELGHVIPVMVTDDDIPLTANGKHDTVSEGHQMVVENTLYASSGPGGDDHMDHPYSEVPITTSSAKAAGKKKPKGRKGKQNAVEMNNRHLESDSTKGKLPMEDTISPYEDVDGTDKPKGAGPVDSQLPMYAEVDCSQKQKKGSRAPELAAYADVNDVKKTKHATKAMESHLNEPEVVEYEEVDFKNKSPAAAAGVGVGVAMGAAALPEYGQVDLSKKHKQGKAAKPPQLEEYAQVDFSKKNNKEAAGKDKPPVKGKKPKPGAPPPRPPRAASVDEGERAQRPPDRQPQYGIEGTLYADLDLINSRPTCGEPTVHANLEPSEYASIDTLRLTTRPADL